MYQNAAKMSVRVKSNPGADGMLSSATLGLQAPDCVSPPLVHGHHSEPSHTLVPT